LIVPLERFEGVLPGSELHVGTHFPAQDALGQLLSSWLATLAEAVFTVDDQTSENLVGVTLDMLAAAMTRSKESVCLTPRTTLFDRVRTYIDKRLDQPDLSPATIAAAHHISTRYLHLIFNERGLTVGGWIRTRRLDQCRAALTDPRQDKSITEIGVNWGFSDAAHFSRTFRASFGTTPTEYRRRVFGIMR
jgi:AraC-like DNA-binding protein